MLPDLCTDPGAGAILQVKKTNHDDSAATRAPRPSPTRLFTHARLLVGSASPQPPRLQPLANVLRGGIEDKIAQVFLSTLGLLDAACKEFEAAQLPTHMVNKQLEPTATVLVLKLGENQVRCHAKDAI